MSDEKIKNEKVIFNLPEILEETINEILNLEDWINVEKSKNENED